MMFSILVVTYNQESTISQTLHSCLNQDYFDYEVVVCDDNSTDSTFEIIKQHKNEKIKYFRHSQNIGEYANRNFALLKAQGRYVIYIDGEDLLYGNALRHIDFYIKKSSNIKLVISRPWNEKIPFPYVLSNRQFCITEFIGRGVTGLNFTNLIFNRKYLIGIGGFESINTKIGDHYIQLVIGSKHGALFIPDGFSWWRRISGQASEKIVKDFIRYKSEQIKYVPNIICALTCFDGNEKKYALNNFYGGILRQIVKNIIKLRLKESINLLMEIPMEYYFSIFYRNKFLN